MSSMSDQLKGFVERYEKSEKEESKESNNKMVITIIGSLLKKEIDDVKTFFETHGFKVNSPELELKPLVTIQSEQIKKIEEADFVIAVAKETKLADDGCAKFILEFEESTSYELAIAHYLNKPILLG